MNIASISSKQQTYNSINNKKAAFNSKVASLQNDSVSFTGGIKKVPMALALATTVISILTSTFFLKGNETKQPVTEPAVVETTESEYEDNGIVVENLIIDDEDSNDVNTPEATEYDLETEAENTEEADSFGNIKEEITPAPTVPTAPIEIEVAVLPSIPTAPTMPTSVEMNEEPSISETPEVPTTPEAPSTPEKHRTKPTTPKPTKPTTNPTTPTMPTMPTAPTTPTPHLPKPVHFIVDFPEDLGLMSFEEVLEKYAEDMGAKTPEDLLVKAQELHDKAQENVKQGEEMQKKFEDAWENYCNNPENCEYTYEQLQELCNTAYAKSRGGERETKIATALIDYAKKGKMPSSKPTEPPTIPEEPTMPTAPTTPTPHLPKPVHFIVDFPEDLGLMSFEEVLEKYAEDMGAKTPEDLLVKAQELHDKAQENVKQGEELQKKFEDAWENYCNDPENSEYTYEQLQDMCNGAYAKGRCAERQERIAKALIGYAEEGKMPSYGPTEPPVAPISEPEAPAEPESTPEEAVEEAAEETIKETVEEAETTAEETEELSKEVQQEAEESTETIEEELEKTEETPEDISE